jgi:hypothetical protein
MVAVTYTDFSKYMPQKTFWLLDTFNGLDERYVTEREKQKGILVSKAKRYTECYSQVCDSFREFPNVKVVRGSIPETLALVEADNIAYLHIDMNCEIPEMAAIKYFWPKMVAGAAVVLDDYGFPGHGYQKEAFDRWAKDEGIEILPLPTGQGLIIA